MLRMSETNIPTDSSLEVEEEEEEVFVDAATSPRDSTPRNNTAPTPAPTLRRSTRKRRSVTGVVELESKAKSVGKRHRPLGTMQRTPDTRTTASSNAASPELRRTSNKKAPEPQGFTLQTDPPSDKQTPEQLLLLGGLRSVLREELERTEDRLTAKIKGVEEELEKTEDRLSTRIRGMENSFNYLKSDVRILENRVEGIEKKISERVEEAITSRMTNTAATDSLSAAGGSNVSISEQQHRRDSRYWKARNSLRIWPITGDGERLRESLHDFLGKKLKLSDEVIDEAFDASIRKVPKARGSKITGEVIIEFPTTELRDLVKAAAYNLAGHQDSGIRLEIPGHLMNNFRALNSACYKLKQKFPACKRNIKFDDETCDLVLDFRTSEMDRWRSLRPDQARAMGGTSRSEDMTAADMGALLGAGGGEGGEDDE